MKTVGVICRNQYEFANYVVEIIITFNPTVKEMGKRFLLNNSVQYEPIITLDDLRGKEFNSIVILERVNDEMIFNSMNRLIR